MTTPEASAAQLERVEATARRMHSGCTCSDWKLHLAEAEREVFPLVTVPAATPSPADRIREAARRVIALAEKATPGPWLAVRHDREGHVDDRPDAFDDLPTEDDLNEGLDDDVYVSLALGTTLPSVRHGSRRLPGSYETQHCVVEHEVGQMSPGQDAEAVANIRWIAALSPAVAAPLAAWLDTHVVWAEDVQTMVDDGLVAGPIDDPTDNRWPGLTAALALADALGVGGGEGA